MATYTKDLQHLDADMAQYIHENTEGELTHEAFINAYLASKGADTVNLDKFRTLPSSQATGSNKSFGRLTNLTQLTVDTTWRTRYRSRNKNPDFGDKFRPANRHFGSQPAHRNPRGTLQFKSQDFAFGRRTQ